MTIFVKQELKIHFCWFRNEITPGCEEEVQREQVSFEQASFCQCLLQPSEINPCCPQLYSTQYLSPGLNVSCSYWVISTNYSTVLWHCFKTVILISGSPGLLFECSTGWIFAVGEQQADLVVNSQKQTLWSQSTFGSACFLSCQVNSLQVNHLFRVFLLLLFGLVSFFLLGSLTIS